jgi:hypothetical protein
LVSLDAVTQSDTARAALALLLLSVYVLPPLKISLTLRGQDFAGAGRITSKENPMPNLEEAIRERAYHLWIADGQPEGKADIYWLNAQHEILTTSVESLASTTAAVDTVATKPAKRARVAGSRKAKIPAAWSTRVAQDRTTPL